MYQYITYIHWAKNIYAKPNYSEHCFGNMNSWV